MPASAGVTGGRGGAFDDRTPRPVDTPGTGGNGNPAAQSPIIRTLQPRTPPTGDDRVIDIMDLPPAK